MRYKLTLGILTLLTLATAAYLHWRAAAPSWKGQELLIRKDAADSFEILFLGDTGTGEAAQFEVADALERYCLRQAIQAIVLVGDNFYPHGVKGTDDPQWQTKFLRPYGRDCIKGVPFYAALGNHDYQGDPAAQIEFKSEAPNWNMPHRFYELQFGDRLQIVVLDTNRLDFCGFQSHCALDFFYAALSHRGSRQTIAIGHHPAISASAKYGSNFQSFFLRMVLCQKAAYYVAGHAHHLEHSRDEACQFDQFISGGGGAGLYAVRPDAKGLQFARSTHGFLSLKVSPKLLRFTFLNSQLEALYSLERSAE